MRGFRHGIELLDPAPDKVVKNFEKKVDEKSLN
jgi:hypothetical protein